MRNLKYIFLFVLGFSANLYAQKPDLVPKPSEEPIDITNPSDVIIYIILPLCLVLLFVIWYRGKRKRK